jgi:hypothetical protein
MTCDREASFPATGLLSLCISHPVDISILVAGVKWQMGGRDPRGAEPATATMLRPMSNLIVTSHTVQVGKLPSLLEKEVYIKETLYVKVCCLLLLLLPIAPAAAALTLHKKLQICCSDGSL